MFALAELLDQLRRSGTEEVVEAYRQLGAVERVVRALRLAALAVLDEREAWKPDGMRDLSGWVAEGDGLGRSSARELVRQAQALAELPAVAASASAGRLSADQLAPLARLATPESDHRWAEEGPGCTPAALEALVRETTRLRPEEAASQHTRRSLWWWRPERGGLRLAGRLPDAEGEVVVGALRRLAEQAGPDDSGVF